MTTFILICFWVLMFILMLIEVMSWADTLERVCRGIKRDTRAMLKSVIQWALK